MRTKILSQPLINQNKVAHKCQKGKLVNTQSLRTRGRTVS